MGLRPTQGDENAFRLATTIHGSVAFPFVIPSVPGFPATPRRTLSRVRLSVRKGA
jgi:hypothetical protein